MPEKLALVTGASGALGRSLSERLVAEGWQVIVLNRSDVAGPWQRSIRADLRRDEPIVLPDGLSTVFHLAGKAHAMSESQQDSREYFAINTEGTRKVLEAAKAAGVQRFVLFSSVKAMGEGGYDALDESAECLPRTPYGESKLAAEKLVLEGGYIPEPVVLRLSMVYGNSEKGNLPRMIRAIQQGRFPPLPDTGNKRSMVHVEDVMQAAVLAAENPDAIGQTYIVTDGTPYSTRQIYAWICESLGKLMPSWSIPIPVWRALAKVGDGIGCLRGRRFMFDSDALDKLLGSACYSSHKIEKELGFIPGHHLHDSLPEIIRFLNGRHP